MRAADQTVRHGRTNCSSPLRLAILLATTALLLAAQARAQGACSLLADPNSTVGKNCPAATPSQRVPPTGISAAPHSAPTATQANGAQPGRGQFVCAVIDPTTGKCRTMRPNTKDYDDAVQTGVEAAMMGMQIQADAMRRAQEMGLGGPQMAPQGVPQIGFPQMQTQVPMAGYPGAPSMVGGAQPMSAGATGFADCVGTMSARLKSATGQNPTPAQTEQILLQCQ